MEGSTPGLNAFSTARTPSSGGKNAGETISVIHSMEVGELSCHCAAGGSSCGKHGGFQILQASDDSDPHWSALVLRVKVRLGDTEVWWKALVDTGAGVNLVRGSLIPEELWQRASKPLRFQTASGELLQGGQRGLVVPVSFKARTARRAIGRSITKDLWFYEGDISFDCILSFRFLATHQIVVVPHSQCLLWGKSVVSGIDLGNETARSGKTSVDIVTDDSAPSSGELEGCHKNLSCQKVSVMVGEVSSKSLAGHQTQRPRSWKHSTYTLIDEWFLRVCKWADFTPKIDAFANAKNRRCERFWDRTINAFSQQWGAIPLWMNPPFETLSEVVEKIIDDKCRCLLLVPVWEDESWWEKLELITLDFWDLPSDCSLYMDDNGKSYPPPSWSTRVCLVDGGLVENADTAFINAVMSHGKSEGWLCGSEASLIRQALEGSNSVAPVASINCTPAENNFRQILIETIKRDFPQVWEPIPPGVPTAERPDWAVHHITLKEGAKPKSFRPFRLALERRDALISLVREMEEQGWIERVHGDAEGWGSPAFPVPKKVAKVFRLVIDYRYLNGCTEPDSFPLPLIDNLLIRLGQCRVFSVLDLTHAFHQVAMAPEDSNKTAFVTENGVWKWLVMPMGISGAPSRLQRIMSHLLGDEACVFIDDIMIGSSIEPGDTEEMALERHRVELGKVLAKLAKFGFHLKIDKCRLFLKEVEFCGHRLSGGSRRPGTSKTAAIRLWPRPKNIKDVRAFLGLTGYYSCYVKNYAEKAAALSDLLLGNGDSFQWGEEEEKSFEDLKTAVLEEVMLQMCQPEKPFVLRVDTSAKAVGASLEQHSPDGELRPIAFYSRKLALNQRSWAPREAEMYGICMALAKFATWIGSQEVTVLTDHNALQWWHQENLDAPSGPTGRRARMHELLSRFRLNLVYRPGVLHQVPDALSRFAYPAGLAADVSIHGTAAAAEEVKALERQADGDLTIAAVGADKGFEHCRGCNCVHCKYRKEHRTSRLCPVPCRCADCSGGKVIPISMPAGHPSSIEEQPCSSSTESSTEERSIVTPPMDSILQDEWSEWYRKCPDLRHLFATVAILEEKIDNRILSWKNGRLWEEGKILVPTALVPRVIEVLHRRSHPGVQKTHDLVKRRYIFEKLKDKVIEVVESCTTCQSCKPRNGPAFGKLECLAVPSEPFGALSMDFVEMPAVSKGSETFDYMWVILCRFTGYVIPIPVNKHLTAQAAAAIFMKNFVLQYGCPTEIVSDNDKLFKAEWWKSLIDSLLIDHRTSLRYRAQGNGAAERANRKVLSGFRTAIADSGADWLTWLPWVRWVVNATPGPSGFSPHFIIFGRELTGPGDECIPEVEHTAFGAHEWLAGKVELMQKVKENLRKSQEHAKAAYDKHRAEAAFEEGDFVWVSRGEDEAKSLGRVALKTLPKYRAAVVVRVRGNTADVDFGDDVTDRVHVERLKVRLE